VTCMMLLAAGCGPATSSTATEREVCIAWRDSLIRPSRSDTAGTQAALTSAYWVQAAACPAAAAR
jgi:hypothetical protein